MKVRYKVLRSMDCDWLSSCFIAMFNELLEVPKGTIVFMNVVVDYDEETK